MIRIDAFRGIVFAASLTLSGTASAETDALELSQQAANQLLEAALSLEKAGGANDRVRALTRTVQSYETGLAAMRAGLRLALREERVLSAVLSAREEEISRLLGALATIGNSAAPLLLLHPSGPVGTARAGMIVSDVAPELQAEIASLNARLEEIAALRDVQEQARQALTEGMAGAQAARTELSKAMAERTDLPKRFTTDPIQMHRLLESSDTLDGFAAGLMELGPGLAEPTGFEKSKGALPLPVSGVQLRGYRETDAAGIARPGLVLATRPGALVTSPWEGTIRYVGPLLDYGNVMIVEPEDGFLLVLAGMGTVYGSPGEVVQAGQVLGLMGKAVRQEAFLAESQESGGVERSETLYMELRQGEVPVDPAEWFAPTIRE